jgi:hypothetical protein
MGDGVAIIPPARIKELSDATGYYRTAERLGRHEKLLEKNS